MEYLKKIEAEMTAIDEQIQLELKELLRIVERFTLTDSTDDNYIEIYNERTDQQVKIQKLQAERKAIITKIQSLKS